MLFNIYLIFPLFQHFFHFIFESLFGLISAWQFNNKVGIIPIMKHHLLLFSQAGRYTDFKSNNLISLYFIISQAGNSAVLKRYYCVGLCSRLNCILLFTVNCVNSNFSAQNRFCKRNCLVTINIHSLTYKIAVRLNIYSNK